MRRHAFSSRQSLQRRRPIRLPTYFFFFLPVGITLATLLAIELAIFATTPFFDPPFFPFAFDLVPRPFDVAVDLDFELVVFFAAFFAIPDSLTLR